MSTDETILSVRGLTTHFKTADGIVKAVDNVSFDLKRGETLGIVGESGSGKSVTSLSLIRLVPKSTGEIVFNGADVNAMSENAVRQIRGRRIAMIFQDPMSSLNPFLKISTQLAEITRLHLGLDRKQAREHAIQMLETAGIPDAASRLNSYPHEMSGGMRQRVMIAMALSCEPELLIADEPTTALDVTIQAQILELIRDLTAKRNTSVILITHDLGVLAGMADKVIVMYAGRVLEQASAIDLFQRSANPYTRGLLKSTPCIADDGIADDGGVELYQIPGMPPDAANLPEGCAFADRCERAADICRDQPPPFLQVSEGHFSLCHFAREIYSEARV